MAEIMYSLYKKKKRSLNITQYIMHLLKKLFCHELWHFLFNEKLLKSGWSNAVCPTNTKCPPVNCVLSFCHCHVTAE